jgi:RNA polymerase sigma-70 factor (ECF subfamily)
VTVNGSARNPSSAQLSLTDEASLVKQAQAGDSEAFAVLYRAYIQAIYRFVLLRVSNPALAEDLTAEVFMKAVNGLPKYSYRGLPFGAWLFRIARDRVVDYYRQTARRPIAELDERLASDLPDPGRAAEQAEILASLADAISQLTEEQREVIQFRFMEDWSLDDTARMMNKSVNAIKALQHRALNTLNRLLRGNEHSAPGE